MLFPGLLQSVEQGLDEVELLLCGCSAPVRITPLHLEISLDSPLNLTPDFVVKDLVVYPPASLGPQPPYTLSQQSVGEEGR